MLPAKASPEFDRVLARCCALATENAHCRVGIVSSFRIHFADATALHLEADARRRFERVAPGRYVVVRVGNVLPAPSGMSRLQRTIATMYPLVSSRFRSCYLDLAELVDTLEHATHSGLSFGARGNGRIYTLLGRNRPTREVWAERRPRGVIASIVVWIAFALSMLGIGHAIGVLFALAARRHAPLRSRQFDTLEPRDVSELLCLYNPYNLAHVALAGYNTGVTHFGWRYPGKTVVKTTGCGKLVRVRENEVVADAGVTIKRVVGALNQAGKQLFVVPNYSYISMGTAFFVPIHGSGSEVSTLGDTIESALVYDPSIDRIVGIKRGEPSFDRAMYAPKNGLLVLRLRLRVRPQARYFVRTSTLESPSADDIWQLFADPEASNIEVRKSQAGSTSVQVSKYYTSSATDDQALEVPRDSIGRVWDRLEENPIASFLFHGFVRCFGYHVELFLNEEQFSIFWAAHGSLPLSKIQLRFVRKDGLPESPFGARDCVSADLFMRRSKRFPFLRFMKDELPHARFNPGKHSA